MTEKTDSSLSFSLEGLESLERDRASKERQEREARALRQEEARARAAERARRAEQARAAAEAERLRQEEEKRRTELARVEAYRNAEVERVRAEVEARTRIERERAAQLRALELEKARALFARSRYRAVLVASTFALVSLGALSVWLSTKLHGIESTRIEPEAQSTIDREGCERAVRNLDMTRHEADQLRKALDAARSGAVNEYPSASGRPVARPSPRRSGRKTPRTPVSASCTDDGDPMNGCLPAK